MIAEDRHRLAVELAVRISDWISGGANQAQASGAIFHNFHGPFDSCCWVLWRLGVAFPADAEGGRTDEPAFDAANGLPSGSFRFVSQPEVRRRLDARESIDSAAFDQLLGTWLEVVDHSEGLQRSRNWFAAASGDRELMDRFVAAGFAESKGGSYRWSDAIGPYMAAAGFWTEDGRNRRDLLAEELKAFVSQLPDPVWDELIDLARSPDGALFFTRRIMDGFEHENWLRHFPLYGNSPQSVARDLQKLLRPGR